MGACAWPEIIRLVLGNAVRLPPSTFPGRRTPLREDGMPRQWRVHRQWTAHPDAMHRWDRAYQRLLGQPGAPPTSSGNQPDAPPPEGGPNASGRVCPGLDATPSRDPNQ